MKNHIRNLFKTALFSFIFLAVANCFAQTPIIKDLQTIISDRPNEFENLQKELTNENVAAGFKEYSSKIENLSFNRNLIINGSRGAQYKIIYNRSVMSQETRKFFD